MATIVEASVLVSVRLAQNSDGTQHAYVSGVSFDANGNAIRQLNDVDIYPLLQQSEKDVVANVITFVANMLKGYWQIP